MAGQRDSGEESAELATDGLPAVLLRELVHERDVRLSTEEVSTAKEVGENSLAATRLVRHFELQAKTVSQILDTSNERYTQVVVHPACSRSSQTPSPPTCKRSSRPP